MMTNVIYVSLGFLVVLLLVILIFGKKRDNNIDIEYDEESERGDITDNKIDPLFMTNISDRQRLAHHIDHFYDVGFEPDYAWLASRGLLPWWNSTRRTRNMSYDLRGDVPIDPYQAALFRATNPWNNSDIPI